MTSAAPRNVHVVDVSQGPLVGPGRLRRVLPFVAAATGSVVVATPGTIWARPGLVAGGCVVFGIMLVAALGIPWRRLPRHAQLAFPFLFLTATLLMVVATESGVGSPLLLMAALPLLWLAIYENRAAVLVAALLAGGALWIDGLGSSSAHDSASTAVFIVCAGGMGVILHGLVADARRLAMASHHRQLALEESATMLDALPELVNRYRIADHAITYCNAAWATQYHIDAAEAIGRPLEDFLSDDELDGLHSQLAIIGPENPVVSDKIARAVPDAPDKWLQWIDRYVIGADGPEVLSIGRDVTLRHITELKLAESEAQFRDLADRSADVVWRFLLHPRPHFDYMSPSVERILGYPASYFLEDFSRMLDILDESGRSAIGRAIGGEQILEQFDFHFRHADGSRVVGETRTSVVRGGLQGVSRDVTELRKLQRETELLALHDPLTGLANRRLFNELLASDLARTQRSGSPLAVAFVDLDDFKEVNDTYGHDVGDLVLCETARRLQAIVRGADTVARIGGDEFVIVYEPKDANPHHLIRRIDGALAASLCVAPGVVVSCSASVGVADSRSVGYDAAAMLAAADASMYQVKRTRRTVKVDDEPYRDAVLSGRV